MSTVEMNKIDKNFAGEEIKYEGLTMYPIKDKRFSIYGLYHPYEEHGFIRMPHEEAEKMNDGIRTLYKCTAGGRVRFCTDSSRIFLRSIISTISKLDHMPRTGVSCFDLYVDGEYYDTFRHGMLNGLGKSTVPENAYDSSLKFPSKKMRDILIHFPLYNSVDDAFIGLEDDAVLLPAKAYRHKKPIVFYGSSITQGACASHPGNAYCNMLSKRLDADIINLGFSGSCRAEVEMIEYIATLNMGILVYDYDHNASDLDWLKKTHERGFQMIREKNPELPIVLITAADRKLDLSERRAVIFQTYENAIEAGDQNVYFIDGSKIYEPVGRGLCTVDAVHPNDIGFLMMANAIEPVLQAIYNKER